MFSTCYDLCIRALGNRYDYRQASGEPEVLNALAKISQSVGESGFKSRPAVLGWNAVGWWEGVDKGSRSFCPFLCPGWRARAQLRCTRRWTRPFTNSCASPTCMPSSRSGDSDCTDSSR